MVLSPLPIDGNALLREKVRRLSASLLRPVLSTITRQGVEEGVISSSSPDASARVILYLTQGYQELAGELFLGRQAGTISFEVVLRTYAAFTEAFERILGIAPRSVTLVDEPTLRFWITSGHRREEGGSVPAPLGWAIDPFPWMDI